MTSWNEGYVTDVPYLEGAFKELSPAWLSMTAVLCGQAPLENGRPLTYVELGCGYGQSSLFVAATCPWIDVWGFDFNPTHVERARRVAARAGLDNCHFIEASFEELATDPTLGPGQVDVIVLHGVYCWINTANRKAVVDFIRRTLVPGGFVYVSYNVTTGWAAMLPVREAIRAHVQTDDKKSDIAVQSAVATMVQLERDGARSFPLAAREANVFAGLRSSDPVYLAHEYLGGGTNSMMFSDVAEELAVGKCSYLGSCTPLDLSFEARVPPDLVGLVGHTADTALRETLCDLAGGTSFRRDLFRRGQVTLSPIEHDRYLDDLVLVGLGREFDNIPLTLTRTGSAVDLDEMHLRRIIEQSGQSVTTGRELRSMLGVDGTPPNRIDVVGAIAVLVAGGYMVPGIQSWEEFGGQAATERLNRTLMSAARDGRPPLVLAATALASFVTVPPLVALTICEYWNGAALDPTDLAQRCIEPAPFSRVSGDAERNVAH